MPENSVRVYPTDRPWVNAEIKSLIQKRQKAFNSGYLIEFKKLRNKVKGNVVARYIIKIRFTIYITPNQEIGGMKLKNYVAHQKILVKIYKRLFTLI